MPRAVAAALVLVGLVAVAVVILLLVIGGITSQTDSIAEHASAAAAKGQAGSRASGSPSRPRRAPSEHAKADVPKIISTLTTGVISGIRGLASVVFGLSLAALSLFFLLKDGPSMRRWVDRHLGVPPPVARTITGGVIRSLRGYFRGVTIVAVFNGVVVGIGALILGVPLAGTIAIVSVRHRLRAVHRRVRRRRVRRDHRARRQGDDRRADHAPDRPPRERTAPEHPAAVRHGRRRWTSTRSSCWSRRSRPGASSARSA